MEVEAEDAGDAEAKLFAAVSAAYSFLSGGSPQMTIRHRNV
jgi:hypothetical protein